jgi:nucleotide-binding universal stress UspA family protein
MGFKKMLIAVDESTHAARAAEVGLELAGLLQSEVAFLHVFDERDIPGGMVTIDGVDEVEFYRREAYRLLHGFAERSTVTPAALTFLEDGAAGTKIVEVAASWGADVIVMGTRGRSVVASALTGSVAQAVLRHAPCPVLAVRM